MIAKHISINPFYCSLTFSLLRKCHNITIVYFILAFCLDNSNVSVLTLKCLFLESLTIQKINLKNMLHYFDEKIHMLNCANNVERERGFQCILFLFLVQLMFIYYLDFYKKKTSKNYDLLEMYKVIVL